MLKKRIIPSICLKSGRVVTSQNFSPWRTVGSLAQYIRLHVQRDCDELFICNLEYSHNNAFFSKRDLSIITSNSNIPITIAGGINSIEKAEFLISNGADRICLCSCLYEGSKGLLNSAIKNLGRQSVVVEVPYIFNNADKMHYSWNWITKKPIQPLKQYLQEIIDTCPGELILTSVDNDGTLKGLDNSFDLKDISRELPVICRGGAGTLDHFISAFKSSEISAVVASSIFSFSEITPNIVRQSCLEEDLPMRTL